MLHSLNTLGPVSVPAGLYAVRELYKARRRGNQPIGAELVGEGGGVILSISLSLLHMTNKSMGSH
jgi:hypothetical protein